MRLKTKQKQKKREREDSKLSLHWDGKTRGWGCLHSDLHFEHGSAWWEAEKCTHFSTHSFHHSFMPWGNEANSIKCGGGCDRTAPRGGRTSNKSLLWKEDSQTWRTKPASSESPGAATVTNSQKQHLKVQQWFPSHKLKTTNAFHICEIRQWNCNMQERLQSTANQFWAINAVIYQDNRANVGK